LFARTTDVKDGSEGENGWDTTEAERDAQCRRSEEDEMPFNVEEEIERIRREREEELRLAELKLERYRAESKRKRFLAELRTDLGPGARELRPGDKAGDAGALPKWIVHGKDERLWFRVDAGDSARTAADLWLMMFRSNLPRARIDDERMRSCAEALHRYAYGMGMTRFQLRDLDAAEMAGLGKNVYAWQSFREMMHRHRWLDVRVGRRRAKGTSGQKTHYTLNVPARVFLDGFDKAVGEAVGEAVGKPA
jgi:hypothetical protein